MRYIGFDPGGAGAFGWCVIHGNGLPFNVTARGFADNAQEAVDASMTVLAGEKPLAAGIDAPLFWRTDGDRQVDADLRRRVVQRGGSGSTVNHVNSLRGACLVQGILVAMLLRQKYHNLPLTESHPKAMLWLLSPANVAQPVGQIALADLAQYFDGNVNGASDHERDAALGALSAWAMHKNLDNWQDLYPQELNSISPLDAPLGYWMPL